MTLPCRHDKPNLYKGSVVLCYCGLIESGKVHAVFEKASCPMKNKVKK